jgi:two-component system phosphate regulon response regulator PhoB
MANHVLIVEDERDLSKVLVYNFKQAGFDVVSAFNGETALRAVKEERFDLVLLDLMLPDMSGHRGLQAAQAEQRDLAIPVMMVTAKGEEIDRIVGFELGADDYVVKPFSVRELILRARAILRRAEGSAQAPSGSSSGACASIAPRTASGSSPAPTGSADGFQEIALTALELRLLVMLYDRRGRVQTRDQLLDEVWGSHVDVTTRNVDTHVKRVREKLGAAGDYIETVRGVGYRFSADDAPAASGGERGSP